jgi:hypothetical protein
MFEKHSGKFVHRLQVLEYMYRAIAHQHRAILHNVGAVDNLDKIDNYNKAHTLPITYLADDDPEMVDK